MQPERASLPAETGRGTGSPVMAEVSSADTPESTTPSSGIRSPGRTAMTAPGWISAGSVSTNPASVFKWATSGQRSISSPIDRRDRATARCSNSSPTWKKSMTATASP